MLAEYLEKAISMGADAVEIEYKDRKEWIMAYRYNIGYGIGSIDSAKAQPLFKEVEDLKKTKRLTVGGVDYRLSFSQYESFGEWVQRIQFKVVAQGKAHQSGAGRRR